MSKIKIVLIEDSKELCDIFTEKIQKDFSDKAEVIGVANDGKTGLNMLVDLKPDIALIDIMLPVIDGLTILEKLKSLYLIDKICCIAVSGISVEHVAKSALDLGAKYYILKPYNSDDMIKRMFQIYEDNKKNEIIYNTDSTDSEAKKDYPSYIDKDMRALLRKKPDKFATYFLELIGIPVNLKGYYYLREAITLCVDDITMTDGVTKVLYPKIGEKYNTTGPRVERSIRHAINKAWEDGCQDDYNRLLNKKQINNERPTNTMFIMEIVDFYCLYNG